MPSWRIAGGEKLPFANLQEGSKDENYPVSIRGDISVISNSPASGVAMATIGEISRADAFVSTCRCLLIPSAFVSGQRTR